MRVSINLSGDRVKKGRSIPILLGIGFLLFSFRPGWESARVIRVISGDTLTVQFNSKWEEFKMIGIKTPDINNNNSIYAEAVRQNLPLAEVIRRGRQSTQYLGQLLHYGNQVWLEFDTQKRDRFGRLLGYVYLPSGKMVNQMILEEGYAFLDILPPNLRYQDRFFQAFKRGKEQKRGYWKPSSFSPLAESARKTSR